MDPATEETVVDLAAFADKAFTHEGVTSKFFRKDGRFFVTTDGEDGKLATFEIKYVFGVDPLQQYMVEFPEKKKVRTPQGDEVELPGGRIQVLSIAWDTHRGRWFHLYPNRKIPAGDWLHWTGGGQNWNYMCAECHSTDLRKTFDLATNTYHTTWSEIDVSCEACHGPASEHVARAEGVLGFWDPRHYHSYALNKLKGPDSLGEIETCAQCHSRRRIVHGDYRPGKSFFDFYEPEKIDGSLYFADGQIKEELYEYGSFLQSRMFREGVRCSNCHDPHSLRPKFEGNALCGQCHTPAKYDTPSHHHHKPDSTGAKCVECHMPERTYMEVDPRRDHSIRIPRPDLTKKLGTPNACQNCHSKPEENVDWQAAKVVEWFGTKRLDKPHFGEILEHGRRHEPHAAQGLIDLARKKPTDTSEQRAAAVGSVVRASAVALLAGYGEQSARDALRKALDDAEPLVRVAAIRAIATNPAEAAALREKLVELMSDPFRSVRTEAANVLTQVPRAQLAPPDQELFWTVFKEWEASQQETVDASATNVTLGNAYVRLLNSSDTESSPRAAQVAIEQWGAKAEAAYKRALAVDPLNVQAMLPLAQYYDLVNRDAEAEQWLKKTLDALPHLPDAVEGRKQFIAGVHYDLGWLLLRDPGGGRMADAAAHFKTSLENEPNNPQALQHYGTALIALERMSEATEVFTTLAKQNPAVIPTLLEYASRALDTEQPAPATVFLNAVLAADPQAKRNYPRLEELIRRVGG